MPAKPSSPSIEVWGNDDSKVLSMSFWQRTSRSSLMSWARVSFTFLGRDKFLRMIAPAASAASIATAKAWRRCGFTELVLVFIKIS